MSANSQRANGAHGRPLKGSWEGLLQEAHRLAARGDDRATAHYWRIIDRLLNFSSQRRRRGSAELQGYLEEALFTAQSFLAKKGRFNDAQELCQNRIEEALAAEALLDWRVNRAKLLSWLDRTDEAIALMQAELEEWPLEIPARWLLFDLYVGRGELTRAEGVVEDLADRVAAEHVQVGEGMDDPLELHRPLVFYLRSVIGLKRECYQDAFEDFRKAAQLSDAYADGWQLLYRPLIFSGQHELANRAINREQSAASQHFWRGLNGYRQGDKRGSRLEWEQAAGLELEGVWVKSVADWVLAHYYLGDEDRHGLELVLRLLNRPEHGGTGAREPIMLLLAGLGWGVKHDWQNMQMNLGFAVSRYQETLQDCRLPEMYWHIARDLLSEDQIDRIAGVFHRPDPSAST